MLEHHMTSDFQIRIPPEKSKLFPGRMQMSHREVSACKNCGGRLKMKHGKMEQCSCGLYYESHGNHLIVSDQPIPNEAWGY